MSVEKLCDELASRKAAREAAYTKLVRDVATGKRVKPADAEAILADVKKTPEDLKGDAELIARRLDLEAKLKGIPELEQRVSKIQKKIDEANAELAAVQARYEETVEPLVTDRQAVQAQIDEARRAQGELIDSAPRHLHQRIRELDAQVEKLARERMERLKDCERHGVTISENIRKATDGGERAATSEQAAFIDRQREALKRVEGEVAEMAAEQERLIGERDRVYAEMLKP